MKEPTTNILVPKLLDKTSLYANNLTTRIKIDGIFNEFDESANVNFKKFIKLSQQRYKSVKSGTHLNNILNNHKALKKVELWGPTHFSPIIKKMNKIIKEQNNKFKYHILMILTDGIIEDMGDTKDELVEGSFLPLSVIIIGVGNADFSNMNVLDADNDPLINSEGVKSVRDLVQFVPFLKYESNPENLAIEVLEEVPRQIVEYYEQNNNLDPDNMRS